MRLPLYPDKTTVLCTAEPKVRSANCDSCPTIGHGSDHEGCVGSRADGKPGGVLYIQDALTQASLKHRGRPVVGRAGTWVRQQIEQRWSGAVAYDAAIRCRPRRALTEKEGVAAVAECRNYTAEVIQACKPERIIVEPGFAALSVLGRGFSFWPQTKSYGFTADGTPVFVLPKPGYAMSNRLLQKQYGIMLDWALRARPVPFTDAEYVRPAFPSEIDALLTACQEAGEVMVDVETYGQMHRADFRIATLSIQPLDGETDPHQFDFDCDISVLAELAERILFDMDLTVWAWNSKFDQVACELHFDRKAKFGAWKDALLQRKVVDVTMKGDLDSNADRVGMGGHKDEAKQALSETIKLLRTGRRKVKRMVKKYVEEGEWTLVDAAEIAATGDVTAARWAIAEKVARDICVNYSRWSPTSPPGDAFAIDEIRDWTGALFYEDNERKYIYALAPRAAIYRYNSRDTLTAGRLMEMDRITIGRTPQMKWMWDELMSDAASAVARMESWGMPVDLDALDTFQTLLETDLQGVNMRLAATAGENFNPNSTKQVGALLFDKLGLPIISKSKKTGAPSASKAVLDMLKDRHPVVKDILDYRAITKMQSNYAAGMRSFVRDDGRIHPSFRVGGTKTGRMSCSDPNLQTIPSRGDYAKLAKGGFSPGPGRTIVQFDYSQIELRTAAYLSNDPEMIAIYKEGRDYHGETAALIAPTAWGVEWVAPDSIKATEDLLDGSPELVRKIQLMGDIRRAAKVVNFGLLFGMGDAGLAKQANVTIDQAKIMRKTVLGKFKYLDKFIKECVKEARLTGFACTYWGGRQTLRRFLPDIARSGRNEEDMKKRVHAEHASWNTPIQGSAAHFTNKTCVVAVKWIEESGIDAKIPLQVHDSIIGDVADSAVDEYITNLHRLMTQWDLGPVPLVADCEKGPTWAALKSVDLTKYV